MIKRVLYIFLAILVFNATLILALRWITPPTSMMMLFAPVKPVHQEWVPLLRISPYAALAVMASEDERFPEHHGFDLEAIRRAMAYDEHHRRHWRGGSTISQQTAKNLFLWRGRTWLRKGLEAYETAQLELFWDKWRIMEVYLNIVQFGPDVYGVEAASERYFHHHASQLSEREAASLAGVLPDPMRWRPDPYSARAGEIEGRMNGLGLQAVRVLRW